MTSELDQHCRQRWARK